MGLKIEAPRFKRKNISATIVVDVKRFCRQLKTDEVFGTHRCIEVSRAPLVIAFELSEKRKAIVADAFAGASAIVYLTELDEAARAEAGSAGSILRRAVENCRRVLTGGAPLHAKRAISETKMT